MKVAATAAACVLAAICAGGALAPTAALAHVADEPAPSSPAPDPAATPADDSCDDVQAPIWPALDSSTSITLTPAATTPSSIGMDAGMRAYIDPETGELTSVPPEGALRPVEPAVQQPPVLVEEVLPDGSVMMDLQGTLQDYMILQFDANGALVLRCSQNPATVLQGPPPPPAREDR